MQNAKIEERILEAMARQEPKEPTKVMLGGGYYYTCYWLACGETVNKFMNYCPKCGQALDWREDK